MLLSSLAPVIQVLVVLSYCSLFLMVFHWVFGASISPGGVCWLNSPAAVSLSASSSLDSPPTLRAPPTACRQHLVRTSNCACVVSRARAGTFQILSAGERHSSAMSAEICCCLPFNVLERDNTLKTAKLYPTATVLQGEELEVYCHI